MKQRRYRTIPSQAADSCGKNGGKGKKKSQLIHDEVQTMSSRVQLHAYFSQRDEVEVFVPSFTVSVMDTRTL